MLKDIQHSNFVIVEVEKVVPYIGYHVAEIFPGKEHYFITDTLSTRQISNHNLLLLKLYGIRTLNRIAGGMVFDIERDQRPVLTRNKEVMDRPGKQSRIHI